MLRGDDSFSDLIDLIVPRTGAVIVLRYVYMDESGTHDDSPVMAMAGYVFDKEQAMRFSRDWAKDCARLKIPFAHMTDCATGNGHYESLTMEERVETEKALIALTRHRSLVGAAVGLDYGRYREHFTKETQDFDAYTLCVTLCVKSVCKWADQTGFEGRFSFVFEAGHAAQKEANEAMAHMQNSNAFGRRYASHSFVRKEDAAPLQAADMLAWQFAHYLQRRVQGHPNKRKDFDALLRPKDRLEEYGYESVDNWRAMMDQVDHELRGTLRGAPIIDPKVRSWVDQQVKRLSKRG